VHVEQPKGKSSEQSQLQWATFLQHQRAGPNSHNPSWARPKGKSDGQVQWAGLIAGPLGAFKTQAGKTHWHISPTSVVAMARALLRNALTGTGAMSLLSLL